MMMRPSFLAISIISMVAHSAFFVRFGKSILLSRKAAGENISGRAELYGAAVNERIKQRRRVVYSMIEAEFQPLDKVMCESWDTEENYIEHQVGKLIAETYVMDLMPNDVRMIYKTMRYVIEPLINPRNLFDKRETPSAIDRIVYMKRVLEKTEQLLDAFSFVETYLNSIVEQENSTILFHLYDSTRGFLTLQSSDKREVFLFDLADSYATKYAGRGGTVFGNRLKTGLMYSDQKYLASDNKQLISNEFMIDLLNLDDGEFAEFSKMFKANGILGGDAFFKGSKVDKFLTAIGLEDLQTTNPGQYNSFRQEIINNENLWTLDGMAIFFRNIFPVKVEALRGSSLSLAALQLAFHRFEYGFMSDDEIRTGEQNRKNSCLRFWKNGNADLVDRFGRFLPLAELFIRDKDQILSKLRETVYFFMKSLGDTMELRQVLRQNDIDEVFVRDFIDTQVRQFASFEGEQRKKYAESLKFNLNRNFDMNKKAATRRNCTTWELEKESTKETLQRCVNDALAQVNAQYDV